MRYITNCAQNANCLKLRTKKVDCVCGFFSKSIAFALEIRESKKKYIPAMDSVESSLQLLMAPLFKRIVEDAKPFLGLERLFHAIFSIL